MEGTIRQRLGRTAARLAAAATALVPADAVWPAAAVAAPVVVPATQAQVVDLSRFAAPVPDPAGIVYLPAEDRLLVADSEVDELPDLSRGFNLFGITREGEEGRAGDTTHYTPEPTALAYDPSRSVLYVTDDDLLRVFAVQRGPDGAFGSTDDVVASFAVPSGSSDPQGITYEPSSGALFFVDGEGNRVLRLTSGADRAFGTADDVVGGFAMPVAGRPQGIAWDVVRRTLVVCDDRTDALYELEADGTHVATVDLPALSGGCDVALAPSSGTAAGRSYWVTTRGVDSDADPDQNDGRLYEFRASMPDRPGVPPAADPSLAILRPVDGSDVVVTDAGAVFEATARDADGSTLAAAISWVSDRDGPLGTGPRIPVFPTEGVHRITASVVAPSGRTASATVTIKVVRHGLPHPVAAGTAYRTVASDGGVFVYGDATFHGSTGDIRLAKPIVGMAATASGRGYWMVASDGGVFAFGDAAFHGSTGAIALARPVVGMAATPSGRGYWLVASDGGIFAFGDAAFHGSTGQLAIVKPVVGMAPTVTGGGYWLVASDGGVFAFGDAAFHGSTGDLTLVRPIVGMAPLPGGDGYWMVASDGGMFAFGAAPFLGRPDARRPVVGMAPTRSGRGYWVPADDGQVQAFGDAAHRGPDPAFRPALPMTGIAGI